MKRMDLSCQMEQYVCITSNESETFRLFLKLKAYKNLSRSREKEALAKQVFTFPGAIPTKSEVRSTTDAKRLDFGGGIEK